MKINILVILLLFKFSLSVIKDDSLTDINNLNKENKPDEKSGKVKKVRSGSMTEGFVLPGFYLTDLNNLKAQRVETFISPNTKFFPMQLQNPKSDFEKIGLVFTFEKFDQKFANLMYPTDKKNEYYLPFRFIKSNPIFRESWLFWTNKSIEFVIANDQNNTYSFYLVFPYKFLGNFISDADGIKLAAQIGEKREKEIKSVKENLVELKKKANEILNKNNLILKSKEEMQTLDSQRKTLNDKIEILKKNILSVKSELSKSEITLEQYKSKRINLDQSLLGLRSQLNSVNLEIQSNDELIKSLSNTVNVESNNQINSKLKEEVALENKDIKSLIEALKKLMPDKIQGISNIESTYDKENGINTLDSFLLSVTPRINSSSNSNTNSNLKNEKVNLK